MIGVLYRKKSPHWGEYQFLSRLKSQVSLARYYEILLQEFAHGTEYIVNTMSREGKHFITDVWHYDKVPIGNKGITLRPLSAIPMKRKNHF